MRTISVHVSEAAYAEFKSIAAQSERPVAELIREAMGSWLLAHRRDGPSLRALRPVDCGAMLQPFDRAALADDVYDR